MEHATPAVIVFIILFIGPPLYFIWQARKGREIFIRRIPGIDAIDEAIGRCVELGRPVSFTSGLTGVSPLLYACLGVLKYIGQKAAIFGIKLFVPCSDPEALVLTDATLQNAYRSENKFSSYNPEYVRYLSDSQFAYASGYMGLLHREKVAGAFLFGRFAAESLILAEAGQQIGAIQVAATTSAEQIPFFITACDYTIIGEELYATGAYLSRDPVQTGSLRGQDFAKVTLLLFVLLGIIQSTYYAIKGVEEEIPLISWIKLSWSKWYNSLMLLLS